MGEDKEKLDHVINFRSTEKMYVTLMNYLKMTGETISRFMREATYDYLKLKKSIEENCSKKSELKKGKENESC